MEKIVLYEHLEIDPEQHNVANLSRATRRYLAVGIRNLIVYPTVGGIVSGLAWWAHLFLNRFMENPSIPGIIPGMMEFGISLTWGLLLIVTIVVFPYCVYSGLRSFVVSFLKPDLSSPESSLKCFLNSIKSDLYERAYNLLTESAQKTGRIKLPRKGALSEKMPEVVIEDLPSFKRFWENVETFCWKAKIRKIHQKDFDENITLLKIPLIADNPSKKHDKLSFEAEFVLVRRQGLWFLANSFWWPLYI